METHDPHHTSLCPAQHIAVDIVPDWFLSKHMYCTLTAWHSCTCARLVPHTGQCLAMSLSTFSFRCVHCITSFQLILLCSQSFYGGSGSVYSGGADYQGAFGGSDLIDDDSRAALDELDPHALCNSRGRVQLQVRNAAPCVSWVWVV